MNNIYKYYELKTTTDFNDITYIYKLYYKNLNDYISNPLYKILINKYEFITYEYLLYNILKILRNKPLDEKFKENFKLLNGIPVFYNYYMFPIINNPIININKDNNYNLFKYYNISLNPYFIKQKNKKICIIKQIGPWEIINNKLYLNFNEEEYLIKQNNITKTIFIYFNWNSDLNNNNNINKIIYDTNETTFINKFDYKIFNFEDINNNNNSWNNYIKDNDIYLITQLSIKKFMDCLYDSALIIQYILIINSIFINAKKNYDLILGYIFFSTKPGYQLLYILYNNFKKMSYYKSYLTYLKFGFYVFEERINKNKQNNFNNIITELKKKDKYLGKNYYMDINKDYCISPEYKNNYHSNIIIESLLNITFFSEEFINQCESIFTIHKKNFDKILKKYEKLKIVLNNTTTNTIDENLIKNILNKNAKFCLKKANKYNLQIAQIYLLFGCNKNLELKLIKYVFNMKNPNNEKNILFKFNINNKFKLIPYNINNKLINKILKYINKKKINIIDITPNDGLTACNFYRTNKIEKLIIVALANNIDLIKFNIMEMNISNNTIICNKNIYDFYIKNYIEDNSYMIYIVINTEEELQNINEYIKNIKIKYICIYFNLTNELINKLINERIIINNYIHYSININDFFFLFLIK